MRRLLPLLLAAVAAGCGSEAGGSESSRVVATTPVVADLAAMLTGEQVASIVPAGADPHDYEIRPEDAEALAGAEVVLRSGGDLDEWLGEAIEGTGAGAEVVTVGPGGEDPHWWHDPRAAVGAVERIAAVTGADAAAARERIEAMDRAIAACVGTVAADRRKLVTTHDALGMYARRYGFEVIGTVIPSLSTQAQPSARATAQLARDVRAAGVPVIFPETSVSPKVEQAIAREAGAEVGPPLHADTLGEGVGYIEAMAANTLAIVAGLGGDVAACDLAV